MPRWSVPLRGMFSVYSHVHSSGPSCRPTYSRKPALRSGHSKHRDTSPCCQRSAASQTQAAGQPLGTVKGLTRNADGPLPQVHFSSSPPCILSAFQWALTPEHSLCGGLRPATSRPLGSQGKQMGGEALMVAGSAGGGDYRRWNTNQDKQSQS